MADSSTFGDGFPGDDGDGDGPAGQGRHPSPGRAGVVLVAFVVLAVLLLGTLDRHPGSPTATAAPSRTTTSTSTTAPGSTTTAPGATTTTTPPSKVPVLVANGSGASGAAATFSGRLQTAGWNTLPPANATVNVPSSTVYYAANFKPSAQSIATTLHLPATAVKPLTTSVPVASAAGADVVVVIGPDLAPPGGATTTTTAPAPTTTTKAKSHKSHT